MRPLRGFTLIELLVVISIIAVLAAILFPLFAQAKGSGKRTQALSNVRQIGTALASYLSDHDDRLPATHLDGKFPGYSLYPIGGIERTVADRLFAYTRNHQIWWSPEDRVLDSPNRISQPSDPDASRPSSFAINMQLEYAWPMSELTQPASTIYLTDRTDLPATGPLVDHYAWWTFTDPKLETTGPSGLPGRLVDAQVVAQISSRRYTGDLGIYLFLDGHARSLAFARTWGDAKTNLHYPFK